MLKIEVRRPVGLVLLPQRPKLVDMFLDSVGEPRSIGVERLLRLTNGRVEGTARRMGASVPHMLATDQDRGETVQHDEPQGHEFVDRTEVLLDDRAGLRGRSNLRLDLIEDLAGLADSSIASATSGLSNQASANCAL